MRECSQRALAGGLGRMGRCGTLVWRGRGVEGLPVWASGRTGSVSRCCGLLNGDE